MHKNEEYGSQAELVVIKLGLLDSIASVKIADAFFELELNFHRGNHLETHQCLKQHLGTNESTGMFYQLLSDNGNGSLQKIFKFTPLSYIRDWVKTSNHALHLITGVKITAQLIAFSWDLLKDVYFLIIYNQFFPISRSPFESFGFQTFFILLLSIIIPNVLNIFTLIVESSHTLPVKGKLLLVLLVFVSPSVIGYAIIKIQMAKEKLTRTISNFKIDENSEILTERLSRLQQKINQLGSLVIRLRTSEAIFESSIQAIILLIAISINFR